MKPRVFVTGGGRGIGRAIALRFAREGCKVVVAARTSTQLEAVVTEIEAAGGQGLAANMNVADHGSVESAVWRAVEFMDGGIDVLVNNAGVFHSKPVDKIRPADWNFVIEANLTGPFLVCLEALDYMAESERAHVFNIASLAAKQGYAGGAAYCASKYGLRGFSDALRLDVAAQGIKVTTVYPPAVDTTIFEGTDVKIDKATMLKPERVADVIWNAYTSGNAPNDLDVTA
jgi:NAD(P)-dependent dehydrogenase (short-subunit alcohol dehydrogenase family)